MKGSDKPKREDSDLLPLQEEVKNNNTEAVKDILKSGLKVEPGSKEYTDLLRSALEHDNNDTLKALLEARGESKNYESENYLLKL